MQITDPIADMLTRIRNAGTAKHETVDVPASKMKKAIVQILLDEGYIKSYQLVDDGTQGIIRITLKYLPGKEKAIQGLKRVSKPGLRVYAGADGLGGLNVAAVALESLFDGGGGDQSVSDRVVDDLGVNIALAPKHAQARTLRGPGDLAANSRVALSALSGCIRSVNHALVPPYFAPVLPSLIRTTSP